MMDNLVEEKKMRKPSNPSKNTGFIYEEEEEYYDDEDDFVPEFEGGF